nr:MAG TPA: hypothetical protein [Caudoviricetes sp.]
MSIVKKFEKLSRSNSPIYMEVYSRKAHFVKEHLKPLVMAISNAHTSAVKDIEYYIKISGGEILGEYVHIEYACGSERKIDVTANSLSAIAVEILREVG